MQAIEELVTAHEQSLQVEVTRCDGPGCASVARTIPAYLARRRGEPVEFTPDSKADWFWLGKQCDPAVLSDNQWEFCSFTCVREFMLGKYALGAELVAS